MTRHHGYGMLWAANSSQSPCDEMKTDWVTSAASSPDGALIVSGSADGALEIWDSSTGAQIGKPIGGHDSRVWSVAFSPNRTRIISGTHDTTVRVWNVLTSLQDSEHRQEHQHLLRIVKPSSEVEEQIMPDSGY